MKNVLFVFITGFLLASCAKENSDRFFPYNNSGLNDTVWVAQPPASASVNSIPTIFSFATKQDSVQVTTTTKVHFSEFLDVTFPAGFARFSNGAAATGKVKVEITHLRKNGDFIRFARPTTSYGNLLVSGGSFFIKVTKEGQDLVIDPTKNITLHIRDANPVTNMRVFYGETNLPLPVPPGTNPSFTWVQSNDSSSSVNVVTRQDSLSGIFRGYDLVSRRFNWVNCDYFIDSTQPKTKISAILPANFTNANTMVFAAFKDQKIVVQLYGDISSRSFVAPNIPINKRIILVSISKIDDDLYFSSAEVNVENNLRVNLTPEKKTKAQIDVFLDAL
jgi:hypothetical protein